MSKEDIKVLVDFINRDRQMRDYKVKSDYDRFCEERCIAIENLLKENSILENRLYRYDTSHSEYKIENEKIVRHYILGGEKILTLEDIVDLLAAYSNEFGQYQQYKAFMTDKVEDLKQQLQKLPNEIIGYIKERHGDCNNIMEFDYQAFVNDLDNLLKKYKENNQ